MGGGGNATLMEGEMGQRNFCFPKMCFVRVNFPTRMICRQRESHESVVMGGNNKWSPRDIEEEGSGS